MGLDARAALLQRCAHFSLSASVEAVAMAVRRLGDAKQELRSKQRDPNPKGNF